jgi:hypothetical protein
MQWSWTDEKGINLNVTTPKFEHDPLRHDNLRAGLVRKMQLILFPYLKLYSQYDG